MTISAINNTTSYYASLARQNLPSSSASVTASTAATASDALSSTSATTDTTAQDFLSYMKESPAQRMQDAWLKQHGISKAQFESMPADEKQKLIDQMKQEIEAKLKQKLDGAASGTAVATASKVSTNILV